MHDRYVNNEMLKYISRPQYSNSCSITALTAIFNYLFAQKLGSVKTSDELAVAVTGKPAGHVHGIGNNDVVLWFNILCEHYDLKGSAEIYLRGEDVKNIDNNERIITELKECIRSSGTALIYHLDNHYVTVVGYFDHASRPENAYEADTKLKRWLIMGEQSEYTPIPRWAQRIMRAILKGELYETIMEMFGRAPLWSRRWGFIRTDLMERSNHCLLKFTSLEE